MRLGILRGGLSWILGITMPLSSLGQALPQNTGGAILHAEGGVWINGSEARDSTAVFPGDIIETKSGSTANLSLPGSTVLIAPESIGKFQADYLELDHGAVSVGTSTSFKVRVNCIRVIPVLNEWTQYVVTDVNGSIQVEARKDDVNVEHERGRGKPTGANEAQQRASVHQGEQKSYDETGICGALRPTGAMAGISPKWIAAGAGGGALILILLLHGGGPPSKPVISPSAP